MHNFAGIKWQARVAVKEEKKYSSCTEGSEYRNLTSDGRELLRSINYRPVMLLLQQRHRKRYRWSESKNQVSRQEIREEERYIFLLNGGKKREAVRSCNISFTSHRYMRVITIIIKHHSQRSWYSSPYCCSRYLDAVINNVHPIHSFPFFSVHFSSTHCSWSWRRRKKMGENKTQTRINFVNRNEWLPRVGKKEKPKAEK